MWESASTTGGSASSLENNNVFGIEPQMYLTTGEELDDSSGAVGKVDPATLAITTVAVAIIAVAGTATCLYYENLIGELPSRTLALRRLSSLPPSPLRACLTTTWCVFAALGLLWAGGFGAVAFFVLKLQEDEQ